MAVWKAIEWESCGIWHCNDVSNLVGGSSNWIHQARIWQLSPAEFIKMLVTKYNPDFISYSLDKNLLFFSFKSQVSMRRYKNDINRQARKVNYQI